MDSVFGEPRPEHITTTPDYLYQPQDYSHIHASNDIL